MKLIENTTGRPLVRLGREGKPVLVVFTLVLVVLSFSACLKVEDFPPEPEISFRELRTYPDSARIIIGFTDGDGDVGLNAEDTLSPFEPQGAHYHNLYCDYMELQNGEWVIYDDLEVPFYYRVPRVEPTGQNPTLIGELSVRLSPLYYIPGTGFDTCKFQIRLKDRTLHISNTIETPVFIKP